MPTITRIYSKGITHPFRRRQGYGGQVIPSREGNLHRGRQEVYRMRLKKLFNFLQCVISAVIVLKKYYPVFNTFQAKHIYSVRYYSCSMIYQRFLTFITMRLLISIPENTETKFILRKAFNFSFPENTEAEFIILKIFNFSFSI